MLKIALSKTHNQCEELNELNQTNDDQFSPSQAYGIKTSYNPKVPSVKVDDESLN